MIKGTYLKHLTAAFLVVIGVTVSADTAAAIILREDSPKRQLSQGIVLRLSSRVSLLDTSFQIERELRARQICDFMRTGIADYHGKPPPRGKLLAPLLKATRHTDLNVDALHFGKDTFLYIEQTGVVHRIARGQATQSIHADELGLTWRLDKEKLISVFDPKYTAPDGGHLLDFLIERFNELRSHKSKAAKN